MNLVPQQVGLCVLCSTTRSVIGSSLQLPGVGICDACSYVLREQWNEVRRLRIPAEKPELVTTYVLLPRLMAKRSELDITGYEFLTMDGDLPSIGYMDAPELVVWLRETLKIVTWADPNVLRRIYVGYDCESRFAEVVLVSAWGFDVAANRAAKIARTWQTIDDLKSNVKNPQAGFVLGVKGGFETVLWRRELMPERTVLCSYLREAALRFIGLSRGTDFDAETQTEGMANAFWLATTSEEKVVLKQLLKVMPPPEPAPVVPAVSKDANQMELEFDEPNDEASDDESDGESVVETREAIRGPLEDEHA
jgi:hypothetical protein